MSFVGLPTRSEDVMQLAAEDVPETFRNLLRSRSLTPLVQEIHREMGALDPKIRQQALHALERLGFAE